MFGANVTMRSLKNHNTGIDISVPKILEVEAPLGGVSVEYEISILTTLEVFKSHLHNKDDVIYFSVYKAYKEIEDFHDKISKKFGDEDIPSIPKGRLVTKCNAEEKRLALDKFMQYIAQHKDFCDSPLFSQFLGINKRKQSRPSFSEQFSEISLQEKILQDLNHDVENVESQNQNILSNKFKTSAIGSDDENTDKISQLFPKMKVRKDSKLDATENRDNDIKSESPSSLSIEEDKSENVTENDDLDLFEEVQKIKLEEKKENKEHSLFGTERSIPQGLFDNLDSDDLFVIPQKEVSNENNNNLFGFETKKSPNLKSITKQTKVTSPTEKHFEDDIEVEKQIKATSGISLFEEQDLGYSITKEDEELFFVAKKSDENSIVNTLLSPGSDDSSEEEVTESLDELITLPEPSNIVPKSETVPSHTEDKKLPPKPVPMPRKRSNVSSEEVINKKPQVPPRTVFSSKPSLPPKPTLLPKPKSVTKPSNVAQINSEKSESNGKIEENQKSAFSELNNLDILQYIEQEEKIANNEASLFD